MAKSAKIRERMRARTNRKRGSEGARVRTWRRARERGVERRARTRAGAKARRRARNRTRRRRKAKTKAKIRVIQRARARFESDSRQREWRTGLREQTKRNEISKEATDRARGRSKARVRTR
jgi:hypothetical protein